MKIFFLKNHVQNVVEKLFPDTLLKNQNWAYLWVNCLKFYVAGLSKYIETELQTNCFYDI